MSTPTTDYHNQQHWPWGPPTEPTPTAAPVPPAEPRRRRGAGRTAALVASVALLSGAAGGGVVALADGDDAAPVDVSSTSGAVTSVSDTTSNAGNGSGAIDVRDVLDKVAPAVVAVHTKAMTADSFMQPVAAEGAGTGFVISEDGVIVTNSHVVADATSISVTMSDGTTMPAQILGRAASEDIAVLKVDGDNLPVAELGDSRAVEVGDRVVAIGNALGLPGGPTVTEGIVSALDRTITTDRGARLADVIQTDAAINPGNSGGPLLDGQGRVIGINTAGATNGQNIGFAIGISGAQETIDALASGETITRPFVGVQTAPVNEQVQQQFGLGTDSGALVMGVTPGSPAEAAGVRPGDVIVRFAGDAVGSPDDLASALEGREPGEQLELTVQRGQGESQLDLTLGSRADTGA